MLFFSQNTFVIFLITFRINIISECINYNTNKIKLVIETNNIFILIFTYLGLKEILQWEKNCLRPNSAQITSYIQLQEHFKSSMYLLKRVHQKRFRTVFFLVLLGLFSKS